MAQRVYTVRAWVELQVRADSPEAAERLALDSVRDRSLPPRPHEWRAACFGVAELSGQIHRVGGDPKKVH